MIIQTSVELELDKISIMNNPINGKGKFIEYSFSMFKPSEHYFFKIPEVGDSDFSIFCGGSPKVIFYQKNFRPLESKIKTLITDDLPNNFSWHDVTYWVIRIDDYRTQRNDRSWGLFYGANKYNRDKHIINTKIEGHIKLSKNFMSRLQAELPTVFTNQELKFL